MSRARESRPSGRPASISAATQRFGLLLVPQFSLIALSAVVDPLRLANAVLGRPAYEFVTLAASTEPVASSDGIRVVPERALGDCGPLDAAFVIGPNPIPARGFGEISAWLRRQAARGVALGGVDTGAYFLARAGLLDGYRCTIHWEDREALVSRFPELVVSSRLVEIDRDRYTCSGGVSPLEMMTLLLRRPPGSRALADQVSDLLVASQRSPDEPQRVPLRHQLGHVPNTLIEALEMMENNLEEPLRPAEIAGYLGVSRRTLERLFLKELGVSPARKYAEIRLTRARLSLVRGSRSLDEVAHATGFSSMSYFISSYRRMFGRTPAAERAAAKPAR